MSKTKSILSHKEDDILQWINKEGDNETKEMYLYGDYNNENRTEESEITQPIVKTMKMKWTCDHQKRYSLKRGLYMTSIVSLSKIIMTIFKVKMVRESGKL